MPSAKSIGKRLIGFMQRGWRWIAGIFYRAWRWTVGFAKEVYPTIGEDRLPLVAGAITYYIILTIIPLLILAISVLALFTSPEQAQAFIQNRFGELSQLLGEEISRRLQKEIVDVASAAPILTGVALLVGIWTGSQIFVILESAMNQVWNAGERRPFWKQRLLALLMLVLSGLVFLIAVVLVNAIRLARHLNIPPFGEVGDIPFLVPTLISVVVPIILTALLFGLNYRFLPNKRVTWHSALPGALFAAAVWTVFLHLFGIYATTFANYSIVYGSLAGLVLLMFWLYYSALIMLVGAEIAAVYHKRLMQAGDKEEHRAETEEI
jgi:membrane protein